MLKPISLLVLLAASGCEELWPTDPSQSVQVLQKEKAQLTEQVNRLQQENAELKDRSSVQGVTIALYDLRHATERFASIRKGIYPEALGLSELQASIKGYLPESFSLDPTVLETIKSTTKGYIFIANVKGQKIVVSNLI